MRKVYKNLHSIHNNLSRAQTARMRKNLTKTLYNIKTRRTNEEHKNNYFKIRPKTASLNSPFIETNNQIYLSSYVNNNNKNTSRTKFTRPNTSYKNKYNQSLKLSERNEYQKAHLNEVQIQNLFTEKLWEKHKKEKNEDYTKKIAYKKLIMRARLLKAMKNNIVLRKQKFDEYNEKYSTGNKLLSEKVKYRNKIKKIEDEDDISSSDSSDKKPELPNFNSLKYPDIFSDYEYTSLFKDFHCTPIELIKKIFTPDEQKIIHLDPIFFRLNKEPFNGVQKNLRFNLKDKINEEDKILQQKIERAREINKKFNYLKMRKKQKKSNKNLKITESTKHIVSNENEKNEIVDLSKINNEKKKEPVIQRKSKSNNNIIKHFKKNNLNEKKKKFKVKGRKSLGIKVDKIKNVKDNINLNINTDYNVYLETFMANYKYKQSLMPPFPMPIYSGEEKIKDKKKRLTMNELFDMYNERKKSYLEDMSYNRIRNKYKFEKLRIQHHENMENENKKKESLRKLMFKIEQNYKLYQK